MNNMYRSTLSFIERRERDNKSKGILDRLFGMEIFFAVLMSSMLGAQFFGISLNKIALIPLEINLLLVCTIKKSRLTKTARMYLVWYFLYILSSLFGFRIHTTLEGHDITLILNVIQVILIYTPILLLIGHIADIKGKIIKSILIVARIQGIWAILQFVSWSVLKLDLNQFVFSDILGGALGNQWTTWYYDGVTTYLRVTGLNYDPAYLALILLLGFCFESKIYWQLIYFLVAMVSSSRAGIVCMLVCAFYMYCTTHEIKRRKVAIGILGVIALLVAFYFCYKKIPWLQHQIAMTIARFKGISLSKDDGSSRHLLYITTAIEIWLVDFGLLSKLIGIGPRTGGVAITMSKNVRNFTLNVAMRTKAWIVECDIAEMLLGNGALGLSLILIIMYRIYKSSIGAMKVTIVALFVMGFMYDVLNTTLIQFYLICCIGILQEEYKHIAYTNSNIQ